MTTTKLNLDKIDQKVQYSVYGFIHRIEKKLCTIIPNIIIDLCLLFYFQYDEWSETDKSDNIHIENKIATQTANDKWDTIFLSNILSAGKHYYKFKIQRDKRGSVLADLYIGIFPIKPPQLLPLTSYISTNIGCYYILPTLGYFRSNGKQINHYFPAFEHGQTIIEMFIDFDVLEIKFSVNGKDCGKADKIQKTEYRGAVSFYCQNSKCQLIRYNYNV